MWESVERIDSSDVNVSKYVFTKDSDAVRPAVAEAVLYKYPTFEERTVVCCSTQSGCPVGCRFCGAGDYFVRSLTADEIVSQTEHLFADRKIDHEQVAAMQIMFMSMGEPLLNLKELVPAIERLHELYPAARLLVSTSAPAVDYEPLMAVAERVDTVGLQFSVHESTNEARDKLIPFKRKLTLKQIADQGEEFFARTRRWPFFNYCATERNSTADDADRLRELFDPMIWQATISVVCERDESIAAANARQRELAEGFEQLLMARGFTTRMFDPAGQDDIGGGCGQLWFVQRWMEDHPEAARPSIGNGLPSVHTPLPVH
jgi:23S rRNA (adenine2503-C2)-methyltransferase